MTKQLFAYKHGDVARGDWQWAIGADAGDYRRPYCVAVTNFHGAIAAGHDPQKLAPILAAGPAMLAALKALVHQCEYMGAPADHPDMAAARAAIAAAEAPAG
jgi:hypothetical protein